MKKIIVSATASIALAASVHAGVLVDFEAGAGVWMADPSGHIAYGNSSSASKLDLNTMNVDNSTNNYLYADFNHFVPIIPNIRVERQDLSTSGTATLTTNATFGNQTFTAGNSVKTDLEMTQNDFIVYWGIPGLNLLTAGILDVNFGIDMKQLDGTQIKLSNNATSVKTDIDAWIPLGYLNAVVDVPFAPISVSGTLKQISYKNSKIAEQSAKISYKLPIPLPIIDFKLEGGYKKQSVVITDKLVDDVDIDVNFKGMFFGLTAKF